MPVPTFRTLAASVKTAPAASVRGFVRNDWTTRSGRTAADGSGGCGVQERHKCCEVVFRAPLIVWSLIPVRHNEVDYGIPIHVGGHCLHSEVAVIPSEQCRIHRFKLPASAIAINHRRLGSYPPPAFGHNKVRATVAVYIMHPQVTIIVQRKAIRVILRCCRALVAHPSGSFVNERCSTVVDQYLNVAARERKHVKEERRCSAGARTRRPGTRLC